MHVFLITGVCVCIWRRQWHPTPYSCLENPMDGGAWWAAVHWVARSQTRLSDFTLIFHFQALEKEMATHSSVLAWRIPGTGEPVGLPSMGSHRVGHDWSDLAAAMCVYIHIDLCVYITTVNEDLLIFIIFLNWKDACQMHVCLRRYCFWRYFSEWKVPLSYIF